MVCVYYKGFVSNRLCKSACLSLDTNWGAELREDNGHTMVSREEVGGFREHRKTAECYLIVEMKRWLCIKGVSGRVVVAIWHLQFTEQLRRVPKVLQS